MKTKKTICGLTAVFVLLIGTMAAKADYMLLNDTFDSASATRYDDADDPNDADWWKAGKSVTSMGLTTDVGGIDDGNALRVDAGSRYSQVWVNFPTVNLTNVGDWLELTFDARLPATSVYASAFRLGLYSSGDADPPSADYEGSSVLYLEEFDGYLATLGTGTGGAAAIRRETHAGSTFMVHPTKAYLDS